MGWINWRYMGPGLGLVLVSTILYFCGIIWPWGWGAGAAIALGGLFVKNEN